MRQIRTVLVAVMALSLLGGAHAGPLEDHVFSLVNMHRAANSLQPLLRAPELDRAALRHSTDMANGDFMSHTGSDGSSAGQRITAAGYRWTGYGENVAVGQTTAEQVMTAWMNSPGHRANILNPRFREIGISVVFRPGTRWDYFWTQDFGLRSGAIPPPVVPPPPAPPVPPVPPVVVPPPPVPVPVVNPVLASVAPRSGLPGVTVTLTGKAFGEVRGCGQVFMRRSTKEVYAAITILSWSDTAITLTFTTPQRGYHHIRLVRADGRATTSRLFFVR